MQVAENNVDVDTYLKTSETSERECHSVGSVLMTRPGDVVMTETGLQLVCVGAGWLKLLDWLPSALRITLSA